MAQAADSGSRVVDYLGHEVTSLEEFQDPAHEWRRLFSELLGTFFLVLVAAGGGMMGQAFPNTISRTAAVVAPGLMVMAIIMFMGKVSGAHLNPSVSIAFSMRGDFPWRRVPGYIVVQLAGAVLACLFLRAVIDVSATYGSNYPASGFSAGDAFLMEAVLTLGLVSVILGTASGAQNIGIFGAIGVGAYIALAGLWGSPISGASMNPARTFGPDLVGTDFTSYWVYVAGPLVGAILAVGAAWILRGSGGGRAEQEAAEGVLEKDAERLDAEHQDAEHPTQSVMPGGRPPGRSAFYSPRRCERDTARREERDHNGQDRGRGSLAHGRCCSRRDDSHASGASSHATGAAMVARERRRRIAPGTHRHRPGQDQSSVDRASGALYPPRRGAGRRGDVGNRDPGLRPRPRRGGHELRERAARGIGRRVGVEQHRLCASLLGARRRRRCGAGTSPSRPPGSRVSATAEPGDRSSRLAAPIHRLPVPGVHERDGVQPDRRDAAGAVGQDRDGRCSRSFPSASSAS